MLNSFFETTKKLFINFWVQNFLNQLFIIIIIIIIIIRKNLARHTKMKNFINFCCNFRNQFSCDKEKSCWPGTFFFRSKEQ